MKRQTQDEFITKAIKIHGNKYDYSLCSYKNSKTKVQILCNKHGLFLTIPNDHIHKKVGCPTCNLGKFRTTLTFIEDAKIIHGNRYDYSLVDFKNMITKVQLICKIHGIFEITPKSHLGQHAGCILCANINNGINQSKSQHQFIVDANKMHHDKYDYSLTQYNKGKDKIIIICPIHGEFIQRAENHLAGAGCRSCYNIRIKNHTTGGYSLEYFKDNPDRQNIPAMVYVVEITNKSDHFYKIGITIHNVKKRFYNKKSKYMNIIPIIEYKTTLLDAFTREQDLLKILKIYQYFPNHKFNGSTECIKVIPEIKDLLNAYFKINNQKVI